MLLNKQYYQNLYEKYQGTKTVTTNVNENIHNLTFNIIIEQCRKKKPIHINFQGSKNALEIIGKQLFVELSNEIFCNAADFPQLNIGDKVRSKRPFRVGAPQPRYIDFEICSIKSNEYLLQNEKYSLSMKKSFSELVEGFIPVAQRAQNETLRGFTSFFEKLNDNKVHDFTPTYFERKSVFIAPKAFYDSLDVKNKIPTTYFPNPREETNQHEIKSIPALPNSIMYFVSRYEVCYQKILQQGKKIDTIVICNTEEDKIQQILLDKNRFGFNLILLTNNFVPLKHNQIPCWNWFKEEIEIVNSL